MAIIDNIREHRVSKAQAAKSDKVLTWLLSSLDGYSVRQDRSDHVHQIYLEDGGDALDLARRTVLVGWERAIEDADRTLDYHVPFSRTYRSIKERKDKLSSLCNDLGVALRDVPLGPVVWDGLRIHPELLAVRLYHRRETEPQFILGVYEIVPGAYKLARSLAEHIDGTGLTAKIDSKDWEDFKQVGFAADFWPHDDHGVNLVGYTALGPFYVEPLVKTKPSPRD